jgi:hypothetical protein
MRLPASEPRPGAAVPASSGHDGSDVKVAESARPLPLGSTATADAASAAPHVAQVGSPRGSAARRLVVEWVLALAPTTVLLVYWASVGRIERVSMLEDDAFYYFGVARSIAEGHGSTFAGSIMTNGYHPLWLVVLVPVTWVARSADLLVLSVLLLNGVLWAGSVREAFRIGRAVGSWHGAAAGIAVYSVLAVMTGHLAFNGMESALVLYLFLLLIRLGLTGGRDRGLRGDLRLGIVLALICLTRLDAAFGAIPVALVLLVDGRPTWREMLRRAVALGAPTAVALGAYLAINELVFGTATPVSGQTKALGAPGDNIDQLWGFLQLGQFEGRRLWLGAAGLAIVTLAVITRRWRATRPLGRLMAMTLALVVGQVILVTYLVLSTSFMASFAWYHYQVALFAFGGIVLLASWSIERVGSPARVVCLGLAGLVVVASVAEAVVKYREPKRVAAFAAADFVDAELPDDAMIAMGDRAGYFGYLARRPLLHLEGLVADADFLHQVERGNALERMNDEGVDYYVTNARQGLPILIDGRRCWRFVEPPYTFGPTFEVTVCGEDLVFLAPDEDGGKPLSLWRYRPELNPAS